MKIALVGIFPSGTYEMFDEMIPKDLFEIEIIDTQEKYEALTDAEIMVLRLFKITKEDIERNPNLKFIQKWGAGYDTVDIEAAGKQGVYVANSPGANAYAVSEIAILQMLAVYRNLIIQDEAMRKGIWTKINYLDRSFCILNKVVGLVGCGHIGKEVARRVQAFGASVQYYDMFRMSEEEEKSLGMRYVEMDELFKTSDIISLHLPLNAGTKHIVNREKLALMKPTSIIVNTSRGGIIKEDDLIEALENEVILGAGLDCVENEPIQPDNPILKAPNVTLSPHIGGTSADLLVHMVPLMVENIIAFGSGDKFKYVVNKQFIKE
ncbi:2-hydroxyacid dehydrogenase [Fusibacter ferrireducens]|uniref:2-hydroxyacid dehydrogenase n=1 Tax=Fusibacter ferrireducens TaxID=2785058 RepID=A0ABR9ZT61_9FIRM|nr:2-hydroxyacid dehydrogenase [Fusibacter ferrireducens]MBF4693151.1 2-hydroxyacid dehydrogenase [Fusibacter ferrireducens]